MSVNAPLVFDRVAQKAMNLQHYKTNVVLLLGQNKSVGVFGRSRSSILKDECIFYPSAADDSYEPETALSCSMVDYSINLLSITLVFLISQQRKYCNTLYSDGGSISKVRKGGQKE